MKLFDTVDFKNKITTYEEFKMSFSGTDVLDRFKDKMPTVRQKKRYRSFRRCITVILCSTETVHVMRVRILNAELTLCTLYSGNLHSVRENISMRL